MLNFRKVLLAAAVAGLGLVGTASAQVPTCAATVATQGYVAVEGTTEELPPFVLTCTGAGTFTGPITVSLTGSVNFVNQAQSSSITNLDVQSTDTGGDTVTSITQPGPNTINITFNTVTPAATQVFTFTGLRVNPSGLPVASTVTVTASSASVQVTGTGAASAAFVAKSLSAIVVNPAAVPNTTVCGNGGTASAPSTAASIAANVQVTAGFLNSLKQSADVNNGITAVYGTNGVVKATTVGDRLAVTLSNLNTAGVNYYAPLTITGTNVTLTAYAAATGTTTPTAVAAGTTLTNIQALAGWGGAGATLLSASTGTATVYYGVTGGTTTGGAESFTLVIGQVIPVPSLVTSYSTTPITASAVLAGVAAPGYPGASSTQTATTSTTPAANGTANGLVTSCSTTLLFPYITNASGFDTGIAIANAATGTGAPASTGSCNLTFYGTGGANTAPYVYNSGNITAGTTNATPIALSAVDAGLTGYAVAVCNFQGAHGYAFLFTSGFGGLAADYVAPILSSGSATTTYTGAAGSLNPSF